MDLHLNDWSLSCSTNLKEQWHVITKFGQLTEILRAHGIDKIIFPTHYKEITIGDMQWKECYYPSEKLSKDQCDELIAIMDKSIRKPHSGEINECKFFSENEKFEKCSFFLGNAHHLDLPVVSFTFDNTFQQEILHGFYKEAYQTRYQKAEIKNLYDSTHINLLSLVSFKSCKKMNPEEQPLWNQEWTKKYLSNIGHRGDRKSPSYHEKVSYLRKHGAVIAELNGWKFEPRLSRRNSTREKIRDIFYSKEFKHKDTYLCIDLEHEDFHFELCDHNGFHLREIHHSGEKKSDHQDNHNINV